MKISTKSYNNTYEIISDILNTCLNVLESAS